MSMCSTLVKERQIALETHQALRREVVHIANMLGKLIAGLD